MYVACGYVVARLCMNVFELAVDTMLQLLDIDADVYYRHPRLANSVVLPLAALATQVLLSL